MANITVTNANDNGAGSLRDAISKADSGDTINFASNLANQTITLTSGQLFIPNGKNITIDGSGAANLTISGNNTSRVLFTQSSIDITLKNLIFANGNAKKTNTDDGKGGGVEIGSFSNATVINCQFNNNVGVQGGGLQLGYSVNATVTNSSFDNNNGAVTNNGFSAGGISNENNGSLIVKDSKFTNNKGNSGGGIYSLLGPLTVENCVFLNNDAKFGGGAIFTDGANPAGTHPDSSTVGGTVKISNSLFDGNTGISHGGALYLYIYNPDQLIIENSTIINNKVTADDNGIAEGGGLRANGNVTLRNVAFANNITDKQGGGLWLDGDTTSRNAVVNIENTTFSENQAGSYGGAVSINPSASATINVVNSTFADNYAKENGGAFWNPSRQQVTVKNSIFDTNTANNGLGSGQQSSYPLTDGGGNIQFPDPLINTAKITANALLVDPLLDPLRKINISTNAGITQSLWIRPLQANSPAINAGVSGGTTTDELGVLRDSQPDIGAVEFVNAAGVIITETGGITNVSESGTTDSYSIVLKGQPTSNVIISINNSNQLTTNPQTLTFTNQNWNVAQNVTVRAINNFIDEDNRQVTIQHIVTSSDSKYNAIAVKSVLVNIADDDTAGVLISETGGSTNVIEGGATDSYSVVLKSQPTADVSIAIKNSNQLTSNPQTLTFTAQNWNVAQNVIVTAIDDQVAQGNRQDTIQHTVTSSDTKYNAIAVNPVKVNITDNDTPGVVITETNSSTNVAEGGATDSYSIVLNSQPTANVSVGVKTDNQLITSLQTVNFTTQNWNTPQNITVTAVNDSIAQGNRQDTIQHTVTSNDNKYKGISVNSVVVNITDNDTAGLIVTETGGGTNVTKGGATDSYSIVLKSQPTDNVNITLKNSNLLTTNPSTLTFTTQNWNIPQNITVTAVNNLVAQGNTQSPIQHTVTSNDSRYNAIVANSVLVNITDPYAPGVVITETNGSTNVTEGGATDSYSVILKSQPTANVNIAIKNSNQLTSNPQTLTFTPQNWNVVQNVTVTAVDDAVAQGNRQDTIQHTATSNDSKYNAIAINSVPVNITDNDTPGVIITETNGSTNVTEGGATDSYSVILKSQPTANVNIAIKNSNQLTSNPQTLTFTPQNWNVVQNVTVTAVDDAVAQGNRQDTIQHTATSNDSKYNAIAINSVPVNITDNDTPGVIITETNGSTNVTEGGATDSYSVILKSQPTANVSIAIKNSNQLTSNPQTLTFTNQNWNIAQNVTVTAVDDAVAQGNRQDTIQYTATSNDSQYNAIAINSIPVNITDNDTPGVIITQTNGSTNVTEGGATDSYSVILKSQPTANVNIAIKNSNQLTSNPQTLTFTNQNWNIAQNVTVTAVDDAVAQGNRQDTIQYTATSNDSQYNAIAINSIPVNITDNDTPGVIITQTNGSTNVTEGGATDSYSVILKSQPTANVSIAIKNSNQLTSNPQTLTFTNQNWNIAQNVTVTAVDDAVAQGNRQDTIQYTATSSDSKYNAIAINSIPVNITDNDTPGVIITETNGSTNVTEGGATDSYSVILKSQPTANVSIAIKNSNQLTSNPQTLTFTNQNWNIAQNVTVTAVDDAVAQGNRQDTIQYTATSNDSQYNAIAINSIPVNITDNDTPGVIITKAGGSANVTEAGGTDSYSVALKSQPTANVNIAIQTDNQLTTNPQTLTFTQQNWNVNQNVILIAVSIPGSQGDRQDIIQHKVSSTDNNYNGIAVSPIQVKITESQGGGSVTGTINVDVNVDNTPGVIITETNGSTNVTEGGATDSYSVILKSQPTANVSIAIKNSNQLITNTQTLTFTPQNWNVVQNVTVSAVDDVIVQGNRQVALEHTVSSTDGNYNRVAINPVNVKITDNDIPLVKSTDNDIFTIKGNTSQATLQVTLAGVNSNLVNELGVFIVDDAQGTINGIAPGANGYAQAALNRAKVVFSTIINNPNGFDTSNLTKSLQFNSGDKLRFYLVKDSSLSNVLARVTPATNVIFSDPITQKITDLGGGAFSLGWKDGSGNSVTDFNNLVVNIKTTNQPLTLGTNLQINPQGEVIDLRNVTQQINASFVVSREAGFNNVIGFYKVVDENGGIDTNGDGKAEILPGQTGYIQAAINGRIGGINLITNNQKTTTYNATFQPGSIYAPFIVANGQPDAVLNSNTSNQIPVYFSFIGANTDKQDHVRVLADNVFGFEDLANTNNRDFNDMIVKVNLTNT